MKPQQPHQFPDEIMLKTLKPAKPAYKPTPTANHFLCCPNHAERCLAYNNYIQPVGDSRALLNFMHKHVECGLKMLSDADGSFPMYSDYGPALSPSKALK